MNTNTSFTLLDHDWAQLSPLGDFAHPQGLQRVDAASVSRLAAQFNSLTARLGRLFAGVPVYIGHPDVPRLAAQYPDPKAYGWITALEARASGLHAKIKWSAPGRQLLENGHYKFLSPCWEAHPAAENGQKIFRPARLLSAGLTNQPNLPVLPLANTQTALDEPPAGAPDAADAPILAANIQAALDQALVDGRICGADLDGWRAALEAGFDNAAARLAALPVTLHVQPITAGLGRRKSAVQQLIDRQARVLALVREKEQAGLPYHDAWAVVKAEHPALFELMTHPQ